MFLYIGSLLNLTRHSQVWPRDLVSAAHTEFGVESVNNVAARVREFVIRMEEEHEGTCLLPVCHLHPPACTRTHEANGLTL
eukprot:scaffold145605_cov36-Tisochrysis_lutea.AAC.2